MKMYLKQFLLCSNLRTNSPLKFMKDLGSRISEATGEKRAKSFLFQSISMNLQRGNALCVMGTVAHHRKLEEIYNLGTILTQEE